MRLYKKKLSEVAVDNLVFLLLYYAVILPPIIYYS